MTFILFSTQVSIKKEPQTSDSDASDSGSEPDTRNKSQRVAASDVSQSGSDSESETEAAVVPRPKQYVQIKQEKRSAASQQSPPSSSSSSDEDNEPEQPNARFPTKTVARTATNFKREPSLDIAPSNGSDTSDDDDNTVPAPLANVAVKREAKKSKTLSSVDTLLQKVLSKKLAAADNDVDGDDDAVGTPTKKSLKRAHRDEANDSLANITSFASPGLSSTMLPESKANRSKKSKK